MIWKECDFHHMTASGVKNIEKGYDRESWGLLIIIPSSESATEPTAGGRRG
jgi:hypothetical protein